jgi:superfamily II DNA/RNA helicase
MPPEIQTLADRFLQNPERIEVAPRASTAATVTQFLVATGSKDFEKRAALRNLVQAQDNLKNAIIFCNRKKDVAELFRSLERHGFSAGALHGDMDQRSRMAMLQNFRDGGLQLLVASDVAARGLDIPDVSHVFNFDVPIHAEDYVHRIGRTGRAGRSGQAFTLVTKRDAKYTDAIEKLIDRKVDWLDGDVSSLAPSEDADDAPRRGRRQASSGKSGRSGSSRTSKAEKPVEAEAAPVETMTVAPESEPAPERRPARRDAINDNRTRRGSRRQDDEGRTPVGFGDDIPAFMMIGAKA